MTCASALAPGSVGNAGPGLDIFTRRGGAGDTVTVAETTQVIVRAVIPPDSNDPTKRPRRRCKRFIENSKISIDLDKGLPVSGGLGGSAASSVAGAYAAALAAGIEVTPEQIGMAALEGEMLVPAGIRQHRSITLGGQFSRDRSIRSTPSARRFPATALTRLTLPPQPNTLSVIRRACALIERTRP
jgi:homoserine kinase